MTPESGEAAPLIDPDRPPPCEPLHAAHRGEGMSRQPSGPAPLPGKPAMKTSPTPNTRRKRKQHQPFDPPRPEQRAPNGAGVKALRPLRGRASPEHLTPTPQFGALKPGPAGPKHPKQHPVVG